jgi:hypothetical protein
MGTARVMAMSAARSAVVRGTRTVLGPLVWAIHRPSCPTCWRDSLAGWHTEHIAALRIRAWWLRYQMHRLVRRLARHLRITEGEIWKIIDRRYPDHALWLHRRTTREEGC